MADHPPFLRHKLNGGIFTWNPYLDLRARTDGDMEPYYQEESNAPEAPATAVSQDARDAESAHPGADSTGPASGGEPEVAAAPERPLKDLHWTALRKLVIDKGGVYTTKAAALKFLEAE
jgi:hypothetical protein